MGASQLIVKDIKKRLASFNFEEAQSKADNEAKTRMYLIEPFFEIIGFNRGYESGCLQPEYTADFGNLSEKKVDYAICFKNKPEILIEAKSSKTKLGDKHLRQLNEYFIYTNEAKVGILTNGVEYQFYARKSSKEPLCSTPFYVLDLSSWEIDSLEFLAKLHLTSYNTGEILEYAGEVYFIESFENALFNELKRPSKDYIKAIYSQMGGGRLTEGIEQQIRQLLNSVSLQTACEKLIHFEAEQANSGIVTTAEELNIYHVIKTILGQNKKIETKSIGYKDYKGKFSVILNNSPRNKVCDLIISSDKRVLLIDDEKHDIPDIDSILKLKKRINDKALQLLN